MHFLLFQIAKLCIIPVLCFLEIMFDKVRYSRDTKLSIMLVLVGVAVCTVSDVSVNSQGLIAAIVAVWSTALQQHVSIINTSICAFIMLICTECMSYCEHDLFTLHLCCSMFITFSGSIRLAHSTSWVILLLLRQRHC
jgi:hypothetical protein